MIRNIEDAQKLASSNYELNGLSVLVLSTDEITRIKTDEDNVLNTSCDIHNNVISARTSFSPRVRTENINLESKDELLFNAKTRKELEQFIIDNDLLDCAKIKKKRWNYSKEKTNYSLYVLSEYFSKRFGENVSVKRRVTYNQFRAISIVKTQIDDDIKPFRCQKKFLIIDNKDAFQITQKKNGGRKSKGEVLWRFNNKESMTEVVVYKQNEKQ